MGNMKKVLPAMAAAVIAVPGLQVSAETDTGEFSSKDEVVYANLTATGDLIESYVVNIFEVEEAGLITDYGPYATVRNLTDTSAIQQEGGKVEFTAPEGKFYYQGNLEEPLPWDIAITYKLDGEEITPDELAGRDGHLQIVIGTEANEAVNPVFFENYLLQISLALDTELYRNIEAPAGMIANAGRDRQVTFTVMPEQEKEMIVEADVTDLEFSGISLSAVPSTLPIDAPELGGMTGDMQELTDGILKVHNGVGGLQDGIASLNDGVAELHSGSAEYRDGVTSLAASSGELLGASNEIGDALESMNNALSGEPADMDLGQLQELSGGLREIAEGLRDTATGLDTLNNNHQAAYTALDNAMTAIPDYEITEEQIQALYASGADETVIDQLTETYAAAQAAKETYAAVSEAFQAVKGTLNEVSGSLTEMADSLEEMADGLAGSLEEPGAGDPFAQLQKGISELTANYGEFHAGLSEYTGGVDQLAGSYKDLHAGIGQLESGTGELESGASRLHEGTGELQEATSDLPGQMQQEVDSMMAEYDKSDFEAESFVSAKNDNIGSVQFIIQTESIELEETEVAAEPVKVEKTFWTRLLDLFS
ncbi:YhgE/Pip domain-containing protein [Planococcus lenghuensis]|uniref:YhgE/Pip domain-containing protein n=1 Tax=Planococcus lenghuensis TaxID=2213202 RepID=A0A1Q2KVR9_9BACL|nr:hypothetical protein [Planococcus lenghuensis]AQQ52291.1 hypothetical protein B0X71_03645 [Planococcus lenghuensis]